MAELLVQLHWAAAAGAGSKEGGGLGAGRISFVVKASSGQPLGFGSVRSVADRVRVCCTRSCGNLSGELLVQIQRHLPPSQPYPALPCLQCWMCLGAILRLPVLASLVRPPQAVDGCGLIKDVVGKTLVGLHDPPNSV